MCDMTVAEVRSSSVLAHPDLHAVDLYSSHDQLSSDFGRLAERSRSQIKDQDL